MKISTWGLHAGSLAFNFLNKKRLTAFATRLGMMVVLCLGVGKSWGQVSITSTGTAFTQNFDGMGAAGTTTPAGWFVGTGTTATLTTVTAGTGSASGSGNYNFGVAGVNTVGERALGSLASGTGGTRNTEARFINNTGGNISSITIAYDGEQWRLGQNSSTETGFVLYYSIDGINFTAMGTSFNFVPPIINGTVGPLDGNAAANRIAGIGGVYTPGSAIINGATFYLRWVDLNDAGTDAAPAVDNFSITATGGATPSIAISDGSIAAGNVNQGTLNKILQRFDLAVTTANATLNGLTVTTAGSYASADLTNLKVRYSADNVLDGGDATLSTKTTGLGAGSQVFPSFVSQTINNGSTGYIFVTADFQAAATAGNTINIANTAFTDISFSGTVNKTGTDPVAAGGVQTIVAVTPDVALNSANPAVPAASVLQNTTNNVVYLFDLAVTTANATLNGVTIATSGTYAGADLTNIKCWYSSDNVFNAGSDVLLSTKTTALDAGAQVFPSFTSQIITSGSTGYIFITADLPCSAINGNTLVVNAITTADISFVSANKSGTANAGGTQTITSATPANVTGAAASNLDLSSSVSWTSPAGCSDEVLIVAATASNTGTPTGDGTAYTGSLAFGSGTALGNGFVVYKGNASPQLVTSLTNGTTYYFKIFTRNDLNWSSGVEVTATPAELILAGEVLINQMSPDFGAATDEYVELVNTTNKTINLSNLKLNYRSSSGTGTNSTTLSGTLLPHSYWLLLATGVANPVTVGQTVSLSSDGTFSGGFATSGQIALLRVADDLKIDGVGFGTLTGGTYAEGTAASSPPTDGGLKRIIDGQDSNDNSTDFGTVTNANIYLHNSASRLANAGTTVAAGTYSDIVVTGNSSIAGNTTLNNKLTLTSGAFTIGANTLTVNGTVSGAAGTINGSSASNLVLGGAGSTLNFTGSSALNNLTLNNTGNAVLGTGLDVYGTIKLNTGTTLNMAGQHVTLKSNATNTACIDNLTFSTLTGATNVTVERYIKLRLGGTGRAYRLLTPTVNTVGHATKPTIRDNWMEGGLVTTVGGTSDPVANFGTHITGAGGNSNGFDVTASNAASLYSTANGATPVYSAINSTGGNLDAKTGYFVYLRGNRSESLTIPLATGMPTSATTLRATGAVVQGTQTSFANPLLPGPGVLNLVTNPYPCAINWALVYGSCTNITDSYTFWDANFGTRGGFVTVNTAGTASTGLATQFIQPGQAFFVESANGSTPTVSIQEDHKTPDNNNDVFLVPPPPQELFRTELYFTEPNGFRRIADGAVAVYNSSFSAAIDSKDAREINNWDENIAIARDGKHLAIESRPVIGKSDDLPLFMNNMKERAYEFEFTPAAFTNTRLKAELIDNFLGTKTPVSVTDPTVVSFTVTADPASKATDRFKVVFGAEAKPQPEVITITTAPKLSVYPNPVTGNSFKIDLNILAKGNYLLKLYDNTGTLLHSEQFVHDGNQAARSIVLKTAVTPGVYQLQLSNEKGFKSSQKIFKN